MNIARDFEQNTITLKIISVVINPLQTLFSHHFQKIYNFHLSEICKMLV